MANETVATMKTADLVKLWGETVEIRKSKKEGARFPLYLAPKGTPVPMNYYAGQEFILENATFKGAPEPEPIPENPEPVNPEKPEPVNPEKPDQNPERKQSAFGRLLSKEIF